LRPPPDLTEAEKQVFTSIVAAVDQTHFQPSDLPLIASYATAIVAEREAVEHLRREGWVVAGRPSPWLSVKKESHREVIALSLRLRLSPQGRGRTKVRADKISA
jgi:phage terminase small subunit